MNVGLWSWVLFWYNSRLIVNVDKRFWCGMMGVLGIVVTGLVSGQRRERRDLARMVCGLHVARDDMWGFGKKFVGFPMFVVVVNRSCWYWLWSS